MSDPSLMTKAKLKEELIRHNIPLPKSDARKQSYIDLYTEHVLEEGSDDEDTSDLYENGYQESGESDNEIIFKKSTSKNSTEAYKGSGDFDHHSKDQEPFTMTSVTDLTDAELANELRSRGAAPGPVTATTRRVYEKKLLKLRQAEGSTTETLIETSKYDSIDHEEKESSQETKQFRPGDSVLVKEKGFPVWWPGSVVADNLNFTTIYITSDESEFIVQPQNIQPFNESIVEKSLEILKKKNLRSSLRAFQSDINLIRVQTSDVPTTGVQESGVLSSVSTSVVSTSTFSPGVSTSAFSLGVSTSVVSPGVSTSGVSSGVSTSAVSSGVSTSAFSLGVSTSVVSPGVSTSGVSSGVSTSAVSSGVSTSAFSLGVSTSVVSPGVSTSTFSSGVSTSAVSPGVSTSAVSPGVSTSTFSPGVSTSAFSLGVSTSVVSQDVSTSAVSPGVSTSAVSLGVSTSAVSQDVSTSAVSLGVSTSAVLTGVSTSTFSSGVSTSAFSLGVSTSAVSLGVSTSGVSQDVSTSGVSQDVSTSAVSQDVSTSTFSLGVSTSTFSSGVSTSAVSLGVSTSGVSQDVSTSGVSQDVSTSAVLPGVSTSGVSSGVSTSAVSPGVSISRVSQAFSTSGIPTSDVLSCVLRSGVPASVVSPSRVSTDVQMSGVLASEVLIPGVPTDVQMSGVPASEVLKPGVPTNVQMSGVLASEVLIPRVPTDVQKSGVPAYEVLKPGVPTDVQISGVLASEVLIPGVPTDVQMSGDLASEVLIQGVPTDVQMSGVLASEVLIPGVPTDVQMSGVLASEVLIPGVPTDVQMSGDLASEVLIPGVPTDVQMSGDLASEVLIQGVPTDVQMSGVLASEVLIPGVPTDVQMSGVLASEVLIPGVPTDVQMSGDLASEVLIQGVTTEVQMSGVLASEVLIPGVPTDVQMSEVPASEVLKPGVPTDVQMSGVLASEVLIPGVPTDVQMSGVLASEVLISRVPTDFQMSGVPASEVLIPRVPTDVQMSGVPASEVLIPRVPTDFQMSGVPASEVLIPRVPTDVQTLGVPSCVPTSRFPPYVPTPVNQASEVQVLTPMLETDLHMKELILPFANSQLLEDEDSQEIKDDLIMTEPNLYDSEVEDQDPDWIMSYTVSDSDDSDDNDDSDSSEVYPILSKTVKLRCNKPSSTVSQQEEKNETDDSQIEKKETEDSQIEKMSSDSESGESDLDEETVLRDATNPQLFIKKVMKSATSKTGKKKKVDRVYNSYQFCVVCGIRVSNFAQHMDRNQNKHEGNSFIKEIQEEKDPKKKIRLRTLLRGRFNHEFNMKSIKRGKGEIILERRPTLGFSLADFGPCPFCFLWVGKKLLQKHQKTCPAKTEVMDTKTASEILTASDTICERIQPIASRKLVKEVFEKMKMDKIGKAARNDILIIQLGNQWMEKNIGNKLKRGSYTSEIVRLVGRLLLNLKTLKPLSLSPDGEESSLWDYLKPEHFDAIVEATLIVASPSTEDEDNLKHPSNAIKLGFDIKRVISGKIGLAIIQGDKTARGDAEDLLRTMNIYWATRVTKLARVLLQQRMYKKSHKLPEPEDIKKLNEYLKAAIADFDLSKRDMENFRRVGEVVSARLLLYNRRRPGELQAIGMTDYKERKQGEDAGHLVGDCTAFERKLLESQVVITVRGKTGRGVPIILPSDTIKAMDYLTDEGVRKTAGILEKNNYVFASKGEGVVRGYDALTKASFDADLIDPKTVTCTNLRKYMATITQVLDLKPNEMEWVINHMGHSLDIHKIHYRCTSDALEKTQIAKILLLQDNDRVGEFRGRSLQDIQIEEEVPDDEERSPPPKPRTPVKRATRVRKIEPDYMGEESTITHRVTTPSVPKQEPVVTSKPAAPQKATNIKHNALPRWVKFLVFVGVFFFAYLVYINMEPSGSRVPKISKGPAS